MWNQILFFGLFAGFIRFGIRKDLFSGIKSQKNDTIGYATLIASEITSEIKPEMYGSLLCAHMGRYYLENLHYCIFDCIMNASVKRALLIHGFSSVSPLVAIKGMGEAFARNTKV